MAAEDPGYMKKKLRWASMGETEESRAQIDSAGAVVFRKSPENGALQVLMITMKKVKHSFPKGHIQSGETREQAAVREIQEETGIHAQILPGFCYEVPSAKKGDSRSVYFFMAEYRSGHIKAQKEEIDSAEWVNAEAVSDLVFFQADRDMYETALKTYTESGLG